MSKRIANIFVVASIYVGISYLLWISKADIVDSIVSIPLLLAVLFRKKFNSFEKFMVIFLGIAVSRGAQALLLTPGTLWRGVLSGIGGSLILRSRSPKKLFSFIIPPVMPAVYQLMVNGWKMALVNYLVTTIIAYTITRREV